MGYAILNEKDKTKTGRSIACLASIPLNKPHLINIQNYNSSAARGCDLSQPNKVMDALERELGVSFTDEERDGYMYLGSDPAQPRYVWHLHIAPFRVFTENGAAAGQTFDELNTSPDKTMGAYMAVHIMQKPRVGRWSFVGQGHTWFNALGYGGEINLKVLFTRTALMFPPLHDMLNGTHQTVDKGYIMATGVKDDVWLEHRDAVRAIFKSHTDTVKIKEGATHADTMKVAHDLTDKMQSVFNMVKQLAYANAAPDDNTPAPAVDFKLKPIRKEKYNEKG